MDEYSNADDLYENIDITIEDQDLRLLKAILTDSDIIREFNSSYTCDLFVGDAVNFAKKVFAYYKTYGSAPTRRVMVDGEKASKKDEMCSIWDQIEKIEYKKCEYQYDLDKVKNRFSIKQIISVKSAIEDMDLGSIDYDDGLKTLKSSLEKAENVRRSSNESYTQMTLNEYMPHFREEYERKLNEPEFDRGIMTGYSYLDYVLNGLSPSDMLIVGGATGAGKSMYLNNLAIQMWMQGNNTKMAKEDHKRGYNVQYFSLEMPYDQCARRVLARLSQISTYTLRDCQISDQASLKRLTNCNNFIRSFENSFEIVDIPRGVTVKQIEERYLEAVSRGRKPDVVVVDYIGLMEDGEAVGDDWLKLGYIAGRLHEFARTYNVVVCTAVQLNRTKSKDPSDAIGLHRIGRSSLIMHHATVGIQLETRKDEEGFDDLIYHIIKNRNGELGQHILKKDFACATLVDLDTYEPRFGNSGFAAVNVNEDISERLDKLGWFR